ncbi:hypothetical protein CXZ10_07015 [Pleomorphomonas diazotrophica]|uniref:CAAX prenyl protease 2/Lysostaphin resistance protein A-like domain-containing protein n=1 Tax=Pleomorphomonas diazotrophica TaxID=1166257 RepID=A0A1I4S5W2_9HYPH|nr:CPBP family intramembrane glutamic endopeptidase [Pleomorphomonas diazotrophica]PKR89923.1 hypothetical protein CXZ10_07015 [Pleomorphomonas diazotrophica]SFM59895.1 CAAX protease self-immunity [Pleomorphomonas diazotrophica]
MAQMNDSPPRDEVPASSHRWQALIFLAITFSFSWLVALVTWRAGLLTPAAPGTFTAAAMFLFMCGPAVGAVICAAAFDKGRARLSLGLRWPFNRWLLAAWLVPALLVATSLAISLALSSRGFQPPVAALEAAIRAAGEDPAKVGLPLEVLATLQIGMSLLLAPIINWPLSLSEELGWRGWLWSRWRPLGFWRCSVMIGLAWGIWHAPLVVLGHNYPTLPLAGPLLMILWCMLISPVLHLIRDCGGSVWHAALFHGTINALGSLSIMLLADPSMPWRGIFGIGGGIVLVASVLGTWLVRNDGTAARL